MSALSGLRVIDCSDGVAGPKAAMLLADFGADTVRVEPPGGGADRGEAGFVVWNRNKRSVALDLADERDRARLLELLRGADICVFSWTLDRLAPLGLDPETVLKLNPGIIYLHLPSFTSAGPYRDLPASTQLLSAISGIDMEQYSYEDVPVDPVLPHVLYAQAMWAAVCAVSALVERDGSGFGQVLTISGMHALLVLMTGSVTDFPDQTAGPRPRPGGAGGPIPYYRLYCCADGEWLAVAALTPALAIKLLELLDALDMLADPRLGGEPSAMVLPENSVWVIERLAAKFGTRARDEWLAILDRAGIPAGPARRREEWFDHPQVQALGMRVQVNDSERGLVVMPGIPLTLAATPGAIRCSAPRPGEHDSEVAPGKIRSVPTGPAPTPRGPLAGVRILDLGVVIAGTFPCTMLAELGADVIKVEPPGGDSLRYYPPTFVGYNLGKRSLVLDLARSAGKTPFLQLVRAADVVIDNYRPGVLERLGLDAAALRRERPDLVTASVTAYGDVGPLGTLPGFDLVMQCGSGMMLAQGGADDPVFLTLPVTDAMTALAAAFGVVLALYHRQRTGVAQSVSTSLAAVSVFAQSGEIVRFAGRPPAPEGGRDFPGPGPLDRVYRTADGWLRLQATDPTSKAALATTGLTSPGPDAYGLAAAVAGLSTTEALARLRNAGVSAVPVHRTFHAFVQHDPIGSETMWATIDLGGTKPVGVAGRYARFSRTERAERLGPPGLGEHSRAVLTDAGLEADAIAELARQGVTILGRPFSI